MTNINAQPQSPKSTSFSNWVMLLIIYTMVIILWGAWVRISGSGAGCGDSWPLCQGQVIPEFASYKTFIEYFHRLKSGLYGLFILGTLIYVQRKSLNFSSRVKKWVLIVNLLTLSEALLGAKLVLFGLVTDNDSPYRALVMSLHLLNSAALVGSLIWLWDISKKSGATRLQSPWPSQTLKIKKVIFGLIIGFLVLGVTGAIAALSNTLFPSASLLGGLSEDFSSDSHFLVRLRFLHPLMGLVIGGSLALIAYWGSELAGTSENILKVRGYRLSALTTIGVVFGMLTLFFLYPVWMKLTHLLLAYLIWMHLILWIRALREQLS